uniref:site-specific DNA-methyltransferase (adenine-specific) n=1 Tax=Candidatus Kentrum sp. DK TaxID=2126562 RepID=A0A450T6S0_9GAMM|nr:MAG: N-6 DNA Methylase [Candidatus Kentron sp. DK]
MQTPDLIEILEYKDSPAFLQTGQLDDYPGYAHVFRKARETCGLQGVYTLKDEAGQSIVPVVYVCEADTEEDARHIHQLVWNQNIVPFLLVSSPRHIRLYSGFQYDTGGDDRHIAKIAKTTREILEKLDGFQAHRINEGHIWRQWGDQVTPSSRIDWNLLKQLKSLSEWLREDLERHTAHALIGKYVYLRYLRDRGILSDDRLARCGLCEEDVFGREQATLESFHTVIEYLETWLNGAVFPLQLGNTGTRHIRKIAAVFKGDEIDTGQYHLDFRAYDFAHIPIETLSVVYEQFLHAEKRGRGKGAYYTPVHVVNFMLDEMEARHPLQAGMTILDPACGSGAFLVQCYRRLIERARRKEEKLPPSALRRLLEQHIFGVDSDKDACSVAGLSLVLTLLDYVTPPDLKACPTFKMPTLSGNNIIESDFFARHPFTEKKFDWVISNPPWREIKAKKNREEMPEEDRSAFAWMKAHAKTEPVGGYQLAEAFGWKVLDNSAEGGVIGMLMPAMSLFKAQSQGFRRAFFSRTDTWCVVNFANLANVLFAGRSTVPAASLFYARQRDDSESSEFIVTYAPFLVNQESNLLRKRGKNLDTWHVTVNDSEIRDVAKADAATGEGLHWKLAMWGSFRDKRLLQKIHNKFKSFEEIKAGYELSAHQGLELRDELSPEKKTYIGELNGKKRLQMASIRKGLRYYSLPETSLKVMEPGECFVRKGKDVYPIQISRPPHIILNRSRQFAIYTDEFVAIPHPQIGVAGKKGAENLLKALSIFMTSLFATYHQIFYGVEFGIQKSVADLRTLNKLPIPSVEINEKPLEWVTLRDKLAELDKKRIKVEEEEIFGDTSSIIQEIKHLEKQANDLVFDALGLTETERYLVEDLVHYRAQLLRGKTSGAIIEPPEETKLQQYGTILKSQLDAFLDSPDEQYRIAIHHDGHSGMMDVSLTREALAQYVTVHRVDKATADEFNALRHRLLRRHSQWFYFERNLTVFDGDHTYLFKPMQRLHWLRSQALLDADNLIADTLGLETD